VSLGSATLIASGATGAATFTLKAGTLAAGNDTITATYSGSASFASSTGSAAITVTGTTASNIVVTAAKTTNNQPGFAVTLKIQETAGAPTTLTSFTINGTNFTPVMASFFGSTQIAAHATASSTMNVQWAPLPATLVFVLSGADPSGRTWTQTVSLATK
jgi:hypothetical protein